MHTMEGCTDFFQRLGPDMLINILILLEDPSDLVRVSAVSSSMRQFVIANGLCKQLCLRKFPGISSVADVIEVKNMIGPVEVGPDISMEWECLERDHRVYAFLGRGLTSFMRKKCIAETIGASSTDRYPEERIQNTLEPNNVFEQRASYWSSKGESDPTVPETLIYKLIANLCVITEIRVQPFQEYFGFFSPIYSAKAVRFRMGYPKYQMEIESDITDESAAGHKSTDDKFTWTYTSPEFPMAHRNCLQKFELPEPILCIGGILQIELLGRVEKHIMDGLYYICVSRVQAWGWPLAPAFDVEILDPSGKCTLKYYPELEYYLFPRKSSEGEASAPSRWRWRRWLTQRCPRISGQMISDTLVGTGAAVGDDESDDELLA